MAKTATNEKVITNQDGTTTLLGATVEDCVIKQSKSGNAMLETKWSHEHFGNRLVSSYSMLEGGGATMNVSGNKLFRVLDVDGSFADEVLTINGKEFNFGDTVTSLISKKANLKLEDKTVTDEQGFEDTRSSIINFASAS